MPVAAPGGGRADVALTGARAHHGLRSAPATMIRPARRGAGGVRGMAADGGHDGRVRGRLVGTQSRIEFPL